MPFTRLSERLGGLPLILAGPILRRVEKDQVTVWVALKQQQTVRMDVFDSLNNVVLTGARKTEKLGENLHIVAVTARGGADLSPGGFYTYDLVDDAGTSLFTVSDRVALTYGDARGPGFVLAPDKLDELRITHSSCRKPHGEGRDMLAHLDALIADPEQRPHMLFLTGDQIYADDVADVLLFMIRDAVEALRFPPEQLSGVQPQDLKPGMRSKVAKEAKLTVDTDVSHSHLLTFGEFCAMYLYAWSPVLWPSTENMKSWKFVDFFGDGYAPPHWMRVLNQVFDQAVPCLVAFRESLGNVRRALANIPIYMMFDDHEVTDDLFLNREWCVDVLGEGNQLGRRIIQNGLAACALFQSWGNTPEEFEASKPGKVLRDLVRVGLETSGHRDKLDAVLGLPPVSEIETWKNAGTPVEIGPRNDALPFHFTVEGPDYRALFLNIRTHRAFPKGDADEPAELISDAGLKAQIPAPASLAKALTFIISPAPVFGIEWIEDAQWWLDWFRSKTYLDYERWNLSEACFGRLLARIADQGAPAAVPAPGGQQAKKATRAVILSGDVHYGYAAEVHYSDATADAAIAHFTASSLKNQTAGWKGTLAAQERGYTFGHDREKPTLKPKPTVADNLGGCYQLTYCNGDQVPMPTFARLETAASLQGPTTAPDATQIVGFNNLGVIAVTADSAVQALHWTAPGGTQVTTTYAVTLAPTQIDCNQGG